MFVGASDEVVFDAAVDEGRRGIALDADATAILGGGVVGDDAVADGGGSGDAEDTAAKAVVAQERALAIGDGHTFENRVGLFIIPEGDDGLEGEYRQTGVDDA